MRTLLAPTAVLAAFSLVACGSKTTSSSSTQSKAEERLVVVSADPSGEAQMDASTDASTHASADDEANAGGVVVRAESSQGGEFAGQVDGKVFVPRYNFFTHGKVNVPGEPEAIIFVQTDNPDMCAHLTAGTMPRDATMFAVVLLADDGSLPTVGTTYPAPSDRGADDVVSAMAYFRRTDASCNVTPGELGAEAVEGQAVLRSFVPGQRAAVDFKFVLDQGDAVVGILEGSFCPATALIDNTLALTEPVEPSACR